MTCQTYELWNEERKDWFGNESLSSSYAELAYDEKGRNVSEIGYKYDFNTRQWVEFCRIESAYSEFENGITRQYTTTYDVESDMITEEVIREYNRAGNDTYYKQSAIDAFNTGLYVPFEEKFKTYADDGRSLLTEEDYVFMGETRVAYVKQWHEYDEAGFPT